jgi:hypothetical protein
MKNNQPLTHGIVHAGLASLPALPFRQAGLSSPPAGGSVQRFAGVCGSLKKLV